MFSGPIENFVIACSYLPTIGNVLAVVSVINRNIPQFHIQYIIYGSGDIQLSVSVLLCLILVQLPRIPNHIRMLLLPTAGLITETQPLGCSLWGLDLKISLWPRNPVRQLQL